jgi:hypothetical protein
MLILLNLCLLANVLWRFYAVLLADVDFSGIDSSNNNNNSNDTAQLTAAISSVHTSSAEPDHSSSSNSSSTSCNNRAVCDPDLCCNFDLDAALDGEYQA